MPARRDDTVAIDRLIHEPARLRIMAVLSTVKSADFLYLLHQTELTKGNLSSHLTRLERGGYIRITKEFVERIPRTLASMTASGRKAFDSYRRTMLRELKERRTSGI